MRRFVLVRHGETEWNAKRILQGQEDIDLSPHGRRQVAALAPLVRELAPQAAVASDLKRARETAAILGFDRVTATPAWREADLGAWEGRAQSDIDPAAYKAWRQARFDPPGGEAWHALRQRIACAIKALPVRGTTLIVTHGGPIRAALSVLIGLDPDRIIPVEPGSLTAFDIDDAVRLKAFNVTGHLATVEPTE